MDSAEATIKRKHDRLLSCDDVSWLSQVLNRFERVIRQDAPPVSRSAKAAKMAALLEIADLFNAGFEDDAARHNMIADFPEIYQGKYSD